MNEAATEVGRRDRRARAAANTSISGNGSKKVRLTISLSFRPTRNCLNWRVTALRCRKSAGGRWLMRKPVERVEFIHHFVERAFAGSLHAKRIVSLANGVVGVVTGASLAVSVIGHALARARGLVDRHAIKQVDRLLSNAGVVVWELFAPWVREMVGQREAIVVAMDWTDFDADNQATLALNLVTRHGRATPLLWLTVDKDELKDQRNDFEDLCLCRLKALLPEDVAVTILADRGFGDVKLFEFLDRLGFGYVIRFRGNVQVAAADGETRLAADWVGKGGRARLLRGAKVTAARHKVGAVVAARHGHERGVASGRQRRKFERAPDRQTLRQAVDDQPGFRNPKTCASAWG